MDQLRQPFQQIADKVNSAKDTVSGLADKARAAWNDSPLHSALSGPKQETRYIMPAANKPAPKAAPAKKTAKMPSYAKGTDYVPKTGPAKLHEGEAVLPKDEAAKHRAMKSGASELGGDGKPAKEIAHIVVKKAKGKDGKTVHIHTHVHTHPMHHPDETHMTEGNDGLADHMMEHMGEANPGEAEADAGQSGIPEAGAPQGGMPAMGA